MRFKKLLQPVRLAQGLRARLVSRARARAAIQAGRARFAGHPEYRPDEVPSGFAERLRTQEDDAPLLHRICTAYILAKEGQRQAGATFNVSNEWLPIYERQLGPVMRALSSRDIASLRGMYQNFYRDPCSTGLAGLPVDMQKHFFGKQIEDKYRHLFLIDALHRHELWKEETRNAYPADALVSPDIGNPYGFFVGGTFVRAGSDYQHYYATTIHSLLNSAQEPGAAQRVVVELGGGFGGMAYYLLRDTPAVTYIDFDLPENLALASYYLLKAFPALPTTLYGEGELTPRLLCESRIILMPSFAIKKLADRTATVCFNSYSLAEMSPSAVEEYMSHIARLTRGYFLHVNHARDAQAKADEFVRPEHRFSLLERRVAGWNLGRNPATDELQFLYKADGA
jgi:putative sugar O-methyltransferase